jgi:hypothetical protein
MPVPAKTTPPWRPAGDPTRARSARIGELAPLEVKLIIPADVGTALAALAEEADLSCQGMAYRLFRETLQVRGLWPKELP